MLVGDDVAAQLREPLGALLQVPLGALEGLGAHCPLRCAKIDILFFPVGMEAETEWLSDKNGLEMANAVQHASFFAV